MSDMQHAEQPDPAAGQLDAAAETGPEELETLRQRLLNRDPEVLDLLAPRIAMSLMDGQPGRSIQQLAADGRAMTALAEWAAESCCIPSLPNPLVSLTEGTLGRLLAASDPAVLPSTGLVLLFQNSVVPHPAIGALAGLWGLLPLLPACINLIPNSVLLQLYDCCLAGVCPGMLLSYTHALTNPRSSSSSSSSACPLLLASPRAVVQLIRLAEGLPAEAGHYSSSSPGPSTAAEAGLAQGAAAAAEGTAAAPAAAAAARGTISAAAAAATPPAYLQTEAVVALSQTLATAAQQVSGGATPPDSWTNLLQWLRSGSIVALRVLTHWLDAHQHSIMQLVLQPELRGAVLSGLVAAVQGRVEAWVDQVARLLLVLLSACAMVNNYVVDAEFGYPTFHAAEGGALLPAGGPQFNHFTLATAAAATDADVHAAVIQLVCLALQQGNDYLYTWLVLKRSLGSGLDAFCAVQPSFLSLLRDRLKEALSAAPAWPLQEQDHLLGATAALCDAPQGLELVASDAQLLAAVVEVATADLWLGTGLQAGLLLRLCNHPAALAQVAVSCSAMTSLSQLPTAEVAAVWQQVAAQPAASAAFMDQLRVCSSGHVRLLSRLPREDVISALELPSMLAAVVECVQTTSQVERCHLVVALVQGPQAGQEELLRNQQLQHAAADCVTSMGRHEETITSQLLSEQCLPLVVQAPALLRAAVAACAPFRMFATSTAWALEQAARHPAMQLLLLGEPQLLGRVVSALSQHELAGGGTDPCGGSVLLAGLPEEQLGPLLMQQLGAEDPHQVQGALLALTQLNRRSAGARAQVTALLQAAGRDAAQVRELQQLTNGLQEAAVALAQQAAGGRV